MEKQKKTEEIYHDNLVNEKYNNIFDLNSTFFFVIALYY